MIHRGILMLRYFGFVLASLVACAASAQTVRFQTNVGNFDMVLNPTGNPLLQGHVDNLMQYVTSGRYDNTVINRADKYLDQQQQAQQFVLQMGGFKTADTSLPATIDGFDSIQAFAPVIGTPGINGLSNTRGTVGMALSGDGQGGTNRNSGTSSFYINLANNSFLDPDFTVFAAIPNMETVDAIMALPQVDLTQDPNFGAGQGNLAFSNVPLSGTGKLVVITRAFVVPEPDTLSILIIGVIACLVAARSRLWVGKQKAR
jgi:cyclophilin family peptidyl-prolyl cis-trans isomerase